MMVLGKLLQLFLKRKKIRVMRYSLNDFAQLIDHTNLSPNATKDDIEQLCNEAQKYNFKSAVVNQTQANFCSKLLNNSQVHVGITIAFPFGQQTIESKVFDARDAIQRGANEIDYVINITELKAKNYDYLKEEMSQLVDLCHKNKVLCKVIFETCYLTKEEIKKMAEIAKKVQPDFIKTSTGFGTNGATVEDVKLMKETVGDKVQVKASGGIRDSDTFLAMIRAGATRIGCSSSVKIINALSRRMKEDKVNSIEI